MARPELVWGADEEGGGPYIYPDPDRPGSYRGFEVELAAMLAAELGEGVRPRFQQGQWDKLGSMLDARQVNIVLNGYELTSERVGLYRCSRPYYQYRLQLLAPQGGPLKSVDDLAKKNGDRLWTVGVLTGSAAETYVQKHFAKTVDVKSYDGNTDAMQRAVDHQLDATLQDDCIAAFYADRFATLEFIGKPIAPGYYVALIGKSEPRLQAAIDRAMATIIGDGRLKHLYDRYHLSGATQTQALIEPEQFVHSDGLDEVFQRWRGDSTAEEVHDQAAQPSFGLVALANLGLLLDAAGMTVLLSVLSMPLAIALGILIAIGRLYGPWFVAKPLTLYVEVLRGTPLMLQLYAIFFLVPRWGISVPALVAAVAGLAINYSAYEAEIYRAGLQAIPRGQMDAALSLGMSRSLAIRRIILPQAIRIVIPPVTNDFIALFKDTSVCSVVTVIELTKRYNVLANNTGAIVELAIVTALLYMLMSYPLSLFARWNEKRLAGESHQH